MGAVNNRIVLLGKKYRSILEKALIYSDFEPIFVPDNPYVDIRLSGHADLSVFYCGEKTIFLAPYLKDSFFAEKLEKLGYEIHFPNIFQAETYPLDAQLNICAVKDNFFYNPKSASKDLVDFLTNKGMKSNRVKQGYTKCSICPVNENAVITGDKGIASAAKANCFDVLLIECGHIELPGYEYGFIGGSAYAGPDNNLYFTGKIDAHPDSSAILGFLDKYSYRPVFLTDLPIFDVGSIIPLD